ncbi:hypothetical protein ANCDUO_05647 [Ancylostoma duodenale]|uniref:Uncharacterized protein n=1 Tax=Ancylostoma duodenale TaxID=51022 RepID=A0A0C2D3L2_9BILA|nr:hypothetical protein ANCDUO_05647 [Ancylostoma duodenale]
MYVWGAFKATNRPGQRCPQRYSADSFACNPVERSGFKFERDMMSFGKRATGFEREMMSFGKRSPK